MKNIPQLYSIPKRAGAIFIDVGRWLLKEKDPLVPPARMNFVGDGDFKATGYEFLRYFIEFGGLKPEDKVLDVGCGIGRMAGPLTKFLRSGTYDGIDIVQGGIEWCQKNITPRYPNFHFHFSDVRNDLYNPQGKCNANEFPFPFASSSFDFVFLTSVFTHLLRADTEHYLAEIARILKPGGRVFSTWFILNQEAIGLVEAKKASLRINQKHADEENLRVENLRCPEGAVGYREEYLQTLFQRNGLALSPPIRYGDWCGRENGVSFQDILVASK